MGASLFSIPWLCWPIKMITNIRFVKLEGCEVVIQKQIAEGAYGTVYLAEIVKNNSDDSNSRIRKGERYALKQLVCQSDEHFADASLELEALRRFSGHDHIIELLDYSTPSSTNAESVRTFRFLFPYFPLGTTWDSLVRAEVLNPESNIPWPFTEKQIIYIISCIGKALQFIHDKGYSHRDVKPHNILLSSPMHYNSSRNKNQNNFNNQTNSHDDENDVRSIGNPVLMDLGSVTTARWDVRNKSQAMKIEEDAASKTSAPYRYTITTITKDNPKNDS